MQVLGNQENEISNKVLKNPHDIIPHKRIDSIWCFNNCKTLLLSAHWNNQIEGVTFKEMDVCMDCYKTFQKMNLEVHAMKTLGI